MSGPVGAEWRKSPAWSDLSDWGKLRFAGADRLKFLHGLVTNDIMNLPEGRGCLACVLTPKGKLVGDLAVYNRGEDVLTLQFPQATAPIEGVLRKNIVLSRTTMEDVGADGFLFLVVGSGAGEVLKRFASVQGAPEPWECRSVALGRETVWFFDYPRFEAPAWFVLAPADAAVAARRALEEAGRPFGLGTLDREGFERLRIASGVPVVGVDTDADAFPAEVNLESAISYDKGCYLGQEITTRIKSLGQTRRSLVVLRLGAAAEPGAEVLAGGSVVGRITSVAPRGSSEPWALALVRAQSAGAAEPYVAAGVPAARVER